MPLDESVVIADYRSDSWRFRVENIQEPTMREIRYLDKLIDELSKGRAMAKILRT